MIPNPKVFYLHQRSLKNSANQWLKMAWSDLAWRIDHFSSNHKGFNRIFIGQRLSSASTLIKHEDAVVLQPTHCCCLMKCHLFDLYLRAFLLESILTVFFSKLNDRSGPAHSLLLLVSPTFLLSGFFFIFPRVSCVFRAQYFFTSLPTSPVFPPSSRLLQGLLFAVVPSEASSKAWHLLRCDGGTEVKWLDCSMEGDNAAEDLTALLMRALWPNVPAPTKFRLKHTPAGV